LRVCLSVYLSRAYHQLENGKPNLEARLPTTRVTGRSILGSKGFIKVKATKDGRISRRSLGPHLLVYHQFVIPNDCSQPSERSPRCCTPPVSCDRTAPMEILPPRKLYTGMKSPREEIVSVGQFPLPHNFPPHSGHFSPAVKAKV